MSFWVHKLFFPPWWQPKNLQKVGPFSWFIFSAEGKMVCELSQRTWSVGAGSWKPVCCHACLPSCPLGPEPLCAPLPNRAAQYAEQPPWWPRCSAPRLLTSPKAMEPGWAELWPASRCQMSDGMDGRDSYAEVEEEGGGGGWGSGGWSRVWIR